MEIPMDCEKMMKKSESTDLFVATFRYRENVNEFRRNNGNVDVILRVPAERGTYPKPGAFCRPRSWCSFRVRDGANARVDVTSIASSFRSQLKNYTRLNYDVAGCRVAGFYVYVMSSVCLGRYVHARQIVRRSRRGVPPV